MCKKTFFLVSTIIIFIFATTAFAEDSEVGTVLDEIKKYEKKLEKLKGESKTLSREIEYADSQISLTELRIQDSVVKIAKKEGEISELVDGIENLEFRIERIEESIESQRDILQKRLRARYKNRETSPVVILFGSSTMSKIVQKSVYLKYMEFQDNSLLEKFKKTKDAFNLQKNLFEEQKIKEENLRAQLHQEKANLNSYKAQLEGQKTEKKRLLDVTQNDEQKYQELLAEAREKLESYSTFVANSGQGVIGPNGLGGGEDGWYFSQRDSRWAYDYISGSTYTIYNSGCLVTSVSMVHKYYGYNTDPGELADHSEYYTFGDMRIPWPAPGGLEYVKLGFGYVKSAIDHELSRDNPVIVELSANNTAGTHFVVLIEGSDGDYKMHDPIYGPDLDFDDYYSTGKILSAVAFK